MSVQVAGGDLASGFRLHPVFMSESTGATSCDPKDLLDSQPRFSLRKLALYFSAPALAGEFMPDSPWIGVQLVRASPTWPASTSSVSKLYDKFRESVVTCIGDSQCVAVSFSGGLDSLAVVLHTASFCHTHGRRILICVCDLPDDFGGGSAHTAQKLLDQLGINSALHIFQSDPTKLQEPEWSAVGPRPDAMPRVNKQINDFARENGAEVLLTGDGSDEVFFAPRFLTGSFIARCRLRSLWRYWRDCRNLGEMFVPGELLSLVQGCLPSRLSFQLYQAINWPEVTNMTPSTFLSRDHRDYVKTWSTQWLHERARLFRAQPRWMLADVWDTLFPIDLVPRAGMIPEKSPYLEPAFLNYAVRLPPVHRYSHKPGTTYHRFKSLVLRLINGDDPTKLPPYKQFYARALEEYWRTIFPSRGGILTELGLLESRDDSEYFRDPRIPPIVCAMHSWVMGALEAGAVPEQ